MPTARSSPTAPTRPSPHTEWSKASAYPTVSTTRGSDGGDKRLAALAHRQHGVVTLAQLGELGLGASGARDRVASGRLHRIHRGVYAVGRPGLTVEGRYSAATLACGPGAGLALRSAAHHRDLLPSPCTQPVHVVVNGQAGRSRPGISVRRMREAEVKHHDGIPTTSIAQTILDLAATGHTRLAERAIARADEVHRYDFTLLRCLLEAKSGARGTAALCDLLGLSAQHTRSDYEDAFLAIARHHSLGRPTANLWIPYPEGSGCEADFAWPEQRLVVEIDSLTFHRTPRAREADYRKQHRLEALGWRVLRFTEQQVMHDPGYVADTVAAALG